jgi:hypothetical protein
VQLDGDDRTDETTVHRGPAAVVRCPVRDLSAGRHRARLAWTEDGFAREFTWEFQVQPTEFPFVDRFEQATLSDSWGIVEDVRWDHFDREENVARGTVEIVDGELRVSSVGGSLGVVLRRVEAPEAFWMSFSVRLPSAGGILIQRNELFRLVSVPRGRHRILWIEIPEQQTVSVDERHQGRWTPKFDHQGGGIAIGVPGGGAASFDDFRVGVR